jgi:hypothetical protein
MSSNEPQSAPERVAITFNVWKNEPLGWSIFWMARLLIRGGEATTDLGTRLMDRALDRLHAKNVEIEP